MSWQNVPAPRKPPPNTVGEIVQTWNVIHRLVHLGLGLIAYAACVMVVMLALGVRSEALRYGGENAETLRDLDKAQQVVNEQGVMIGYQWHNRLIDTADYEHLKSTAHYLGATRLCWSGSGAWSVNTASPCYDSDWKAQYALHAFSLIILVLALGLLGLAFWLTWRASAGTRFGE